jgi:hypothetical protein
MKDKDPRVDHTQYDPLPSVAEPLATAATNEPVPTKEPYFVEVDVTGCRCCGAGKTWTVIGPDGVAASRSWECVSDAEDFAEALNDAFYKGVANDEVSEVE